MLVAEPKVYLITRPSLCVVGVAQFFRDEGLHVAKGEASDGETACEYAGRLCYHSFSKGRTSNRDFLNNIISSHHGSVLEHANYGFIITGVSRSCTHELVRHRHLSYSQRSQRYVDESHAKVVIPDAIKDDQGMAGTFERLANTSQTAYGVLVSNLELKYTDVGDKTLRRKMAREDARSVLPDATETKIFVTGNIRAWRHFLETRGSVHAAKEIRSVAILIYEALRVEAPHFFQDYTISDGVIVAGHRKV